MQLLKINTKRNEMIKMWMKVLNSRPKIATRWVLQDHSVFVSVDSMAGLPTDWSNSNKSYTDSISKTLTKTRTIKKVMSIKLSLSNVKIKHPKSKRKRLKFKKHI